MCTLVRNSCVTRWFNNFSMSNKELQVDCEAPWSMCVSSAPWLFHDLHHIGKRILVVREWLCDRGAHIEDRLDLSSGDLRYRGTSSIDPAKKSTYPHGNASMCRESSMTDHIRVQSCNSQESARLTGTSTSTPKSMFHATCMTLVTQLTTSRPKKQYCKRVHRNLGAQAVPGARQLSGRRWHERNPTTPPGTSCCPSTDALIVPWLRHVVGLRCQNLLEITIISKSRYRAWHRKKLSILVQVSVISWNLWRRIRSSWERPTAQYLGFFRFCDLRRRRRDSESTITPHQYWNVCDYREGKLNQFSSSFHQLTAGGKGRPHSPSECTIPT